MFELTPMHYFLIYINDCIKVLRLSQIELEKAVTEIYGVTLKTSQPKVIYNEIPGLENIIGCYPHSFILSDYRFWGQPEVHQELLDWLQQNFSLDTYTLQGMVLSFKTAKEAMWFKLRWVGVDN